jgi:quercetin dioxygenase-like cupin family protein
MTVQRFCPASFASIASGVLLAWFVAADANAQAPGVSLKPLLRTTLSGDETKESVMISAEFAPGSTTGRHTHPGDEYTFVLQGTLELIAEGRETRRVSAGDGYHNPRGLVHEARNVGDTPARVAITFVIDKGQPITQPVAK